MILILGSPEDGCVRETGFYLRQRGREMLVVPEAQLPSSLQIRWELPASTETGYLVFKLPLARLRQQRPSRREQPRFEMPGAVPGGLAPAAASRGPGGGPTVSVPLTELTGVLVRLRQTFEAIPADVSDRGYMRAEWSALLYGFLRSLPCPVVNRPRPGAGQWLPETRAVAEALRQTGFLLAPTLATASAGAAREFFEHHGRRVLCASPGFGRVLLLEGDAAGGMFSAGVTQSFRLQAAPVGRWLRVLVVGRAAFGAEARRESLLEGDGELWRGVVLAPAVARRCARLASALGLSFAGLLLVCAKAGDFVLAVDEFPNPTQCEAGLRDRITAALAGVLTGASSLKL